MSLNIFKLLNIEDAEKNKISLFLLQSIFLGVFYGVFDTSAMALFFESFDDTTLSKAYLVSGVVGMAMTLFYSKLQDLISFKSLSILNMIAIILITLFLWSGFKFSQSKWLVFSLVVMMGPLNIIAMLGFWGSATRMFTLRQGKRFFGLIDSGQIVGVALSSFAIPVLLTFNIPISDFILLCGISISFALIFQVVIVRKYGKLLQFAETSKTENKTSKAGNFKALLKNKYILLMMVFVTLSMLVAFFTVFIFMVAANDNYPDSTALAKFLGIFTGTTMIFTLVVKTSVYSWLMKTYGVKVSLLISSVFVGVSVIGAAIAGKFYGFTSASSSFLIFFLIIALSRLFSRAFKDSIEGPSFKLLYQSLDETIRYQVQSRIDGTVNEFAALFSGLALTIFGLISWFNLLGYTYALVIIVIVWFFVGRLLYKYYRKSLEESLQNAVHSNNDNEKNFQNTLLSQNIMCGQNDEYTEKLISDICYSSIELSALNYIENKGVDEVIAKVLIENNLFSVASNLKYKQKVFEEWQNSFSKYSEKDIERLYKSDNKINRLIAIFLLEKSSLKDEERIITVLLKDSDIDVKRRAIKLIGNKKITGLTSLIVDLLANAYTVIDCRSALYSMGDVVLPQLESAFHKSEISTNQLCNIVKVYGAINTPKSIELLVSKLSFRLRPVAITAAEALECNNFKATEHNIHNIIHAIRETAYIASWNQVALFSCKNIENSDLLFTALTNELSITTKELYLQLSLAYDSSSVKTIKSNIDGGTNESTSFALELFDMLLDDELKPVITPLFDDISAGEKVKALQAEFPVSLLNKSELITAVINRDFNLISPWAKICAIKLSQDIPELNGSDTIVAHIFNTDSALRNVAAEVLYNTEINVFNDAISRIDTHWKKEILDLVNSEDTKKSFFNTFNLMLDSQLSEHLDSREQYFVVKKLRTIDNNNIKQECLNNNVIVLLSGNLNITTPTKSYQYEHAAICDLRKIISQDISQIDFTTTGNSIVAVINDEDFVDIMLAINKVAELIVD